MKITIYKMNLPFREPFKHNLGIRTNSESILVKIEDEGVVGYGEGLPRTITGETQDKSIQYIIEECIPFFQKNNSPVFSVLNHNPKTIDGVYYGSATCAFSTALLDLQTKKEGHPIHSLFEGNHGAEICYIAVLGERSQYRTIKSLLKYKLWGFKEVKIKLSKDSGIEPVRLARKIMGKNCKISVDCNCAYPFQKGIDICNQLEKYNVVGIEEPFIDNDPLTICLAQEHTQIPIIVDETMCSYKDAERLIDLDFRGIFNLRLSKCGGLSNCVKIYDLAMSHKIRVKLGCHPGESSILSALGRHMAISCPFESVEGSYGHHLLVSDIAMKSVQFGYKGKGKLINKPGLGIEISEEKVARYCEKIYSKKI